jgi:hypothetical protein
MTTLQQMAEAMTEEFVRQFQSEIRAPVRTQAGRTLLDGWFDLEAVARAGLAAIVEPARDVATAGGDAEYWPRSLGGEATACVTKAAALAAWRAMIGEMLVPAAEAEARSEQVDIRALNVALGHCDPLPNAGGDA